MNKQAKGIIFFGLIFAFADQMLKIILSAKLTLHNSFLLINDLLYLNLTHNTGAAFGFFQGSRFLLIAIAIFAIIIIYLMAANEEVLTDGNILTYALLIGGILGNMVDRIIHGYVIDYISITVGKFSFPIFNFADICITLSIVILILGTIFGSTFK